MTSDDNTPQEPFPPTIVPLEDLLDGPKEPIATTEEPPPETKESQSNLLQFPKKFDASQKPQIKYRKGDWVRYYGTEGRLSIAQIEYVTILNANSVAFLTDRGIVPDHMIVEARRVQE